jgi:hypothetical protein
VTRRFPLLMAEAGADGGAGAGAGADTGTGAAGATPWTETMFEDAALRTSPTFARYKSADDFARGHLELERKFGERPQGLQVPGQDATPEAVQAFRTALGVPQTPDKYTTTAPTMPDGMPQMAPEAFQGFLAEAHKAGMTDAQLAPIVQWYAQYSAQQWQAFQEGEGAQRQAGYEQLKQHWGAMADHNIAVAMEGLRREFGDTGWVETMVAKDADGRPQLLGNVPQFVQMAYELARLKGHDRFVPGGAHGATSAQDAQERINRARGELREGRMTPADFQAVQQRYGPLAYGSQRDGLQVGAFTGIDLREEER